MALADYVDPASVEAAQLAFEEIRTHGEAADRAMHALAAERTEAPDALAMATLIWVENMFLRVRGRTLDYSALLGPILDQVVPHAPAAGPSVAMTAEHVSRVPAIVQAGLAYHTITGALMNVAQGRMAAHWTVPRDRLVVVPSGDLDAELRNRWFELRWRGGRNEAGQAIVPRNVAEVVPQIDAHVANQAQSILRGVYVPPIADWYEEYCGSFVDGVLNGQFDHVGPAETWAGLSVDDLKRGVRPIWMRAARRVLGHLRAMKWLKEIAARPETTLLSAVERVTPDALQADLVAAGLTAAAARTLLDTMTRRRGGERFPVESYPLLPMPDGDIAFVPSCILYGNWPMGRERAAARDIRDERIGNVRDRRHVERVAVALRTGLEGGHVATEVLVRQENGQALTDLDVLCVDTTRHTVLVLQLKSFVTPLNLLDLRRADDDIAEGIAQCRTAAVNRERTKLAIEGEIGGPLHPEWQLYQFVVTEAFAGTFAPDPDHPVVTLEWLEHEGTRAVREGGIALLHERARTLPDGAEFFASCEPFLEEFDDGAQGLRTGTSYSIGAYISA